MSAETDAIIAATNQRLHDLQAIESEIVAKVAAITAAAVPGQGLTVADIKRIQDLRKSQKVVLASIEELGLVTAAALDDTATLHHLVDSLGQVVSDLNAQTQAITQIGNVCSSISSVCTGIDNIVTKLTAQIGA